MSLLLGASGTSAALGVPAPAEAATEGRTSGSLHDTGQVVPLLEPGGPRDHVDDGYLILNPSTRRGYQLFRPTNRAANETVLWSFDLDTLQPVRRSVIKNFSVIATGDQASSLGDVVHAVDEVRGRIYLAGLRQAAVPLTHHAMEVVVVDEQKLDEGLSEDGFVLRRLPIPPTHQPQMLLGSILTGAIVGGPVNNAPSGTAVRGMVFSRASGVPKLLLIFGSINTGVLGNIHLLAQWDPESPGSDYGDWIIRLRACEGGPLTTNIGWQYQFGILRAASNVSIGCSAPTAQAVRFPLLGPDGRPDPNGIPNETTFDAFPIPRQFANVLADQKSERLLLQVQGNGKTWWVFDAKAGAWVGGAGETLHDVRTASGVDPATGRLYSLVPDHIKTVPAPTQPVKGGFMFTDTRLTPVPQMRNAIPSLAYLGQFRMSVDPEAPGRVRRLFVRRGGIFTAGVTYPETAGETQFPAEEFYKVIEDTIPISEDPPFGDVDENTENVLEEVGVTGAKFSVSGSAFGFRTLVVGGINALVSRNNLDPIITAACYKNDREASIGLIEGAGLSDLTASAASVSLSADESTKADLENPSRCAPRTDVNLPTPISQALDSLAGQEWDSNEDGRDDYTAECSGDESRVEAPTPTGVGSAYSSWVECNKSEESVKGFSSGRFTVRGDAAPVSVMHATSQITARRSEDGGTIVEVEAIARGIEIAEVGTIGVVRTVAVARSAGRPKTAETSFNRFFCGVDMPGLKIASCLTDDQQKQLVDTLNLLLVRTNGKARLRHPDPDLYRGSEGGYLAAVQRNRMEALDDKMVTRDFSETVPGLEIIFYRGDSTTQGAGRQVFQFAGVEASSAYGIFCLFGDTKNEDGDISCVRPTSELKVQLTDDFEENPTSLPGGVFQIHLDEDGDGILGVDDAVLELGDAEAVCTTTDDGVGDCVFDLPPGKYIVHQVKAPDGFAPSPDCAVFLPAFASMTCDFVNSPNIGLIYVGLTDDSPEANPLSGGVFELYMDDGDQKLGTGDTKLALCTTNVFGDCVYKLPDISGKANPIVCAGSPIESEELQDLIQMECIFDPDQGGNILAVELATFIVHQTVAPPDYSVAEDQVLPLANPWDIGIASFVNGLAPVEGTPPIEGTGTPSRQSTVVIEGGSAPRAPVKQSAPRKEPEPPKIITRIVMAPSEAIGFLLRHPKQAAMFASIWLLLAAPLWLVWRRRSISILKGAA